MKPKLEITTPAAKERIEIEKKSWRRTNTCMGTR